VTYDVLPPPLPGPDVCSVCHNSTPGYRRCRSCRDVASEAGFKVDEVPTVIPLGLAFKKSRLAVDLWNYKRGDTSTARKRASERLREFIDTTMPHVASHADPFDIVTFVPSRRTTNNEVLGLFRQTDWGRSAGIKELLSIHDAGGNSHAVNVDRFTSADVSGSRVLLLDDTYTRGATTMSAARALVDAGARSVTIIILGRHMSEDYVTPEYLQAVRSRQSMGEFCPCCPQMRQADIAKSVDSVEPGGDSPPRGKYLPPPLPEYEPPAQPKKRPPPVPKYRPPNRPQDPAPALPTMAQPGAGETPFSRVRAWMADHPMSSTVAILFLAILLVGGISNLFDPERTRSGSGDSDQGRCLLSNGDRAACSSPRAAYRITSVENDWSDCSDEYFREVANSGIYYCVDSISQDAPASEPAIEDPDDWESELGKCLTNDGEEVGCSSAEARFQIRLVVNDDTACELPEYDGDIFYEEDYESISYCTSTGIDATLDPTASE